MCRMAVLFCCGIVGGAISPRTFWLAPVGIVFGQSLYGMMRPHHGPLFLAGLLLLPLFSVPSAFGALVSFVGRAGHREVPLAC